ncbi:MAG: methyl-accepting chemotaxis protein [Spirochaetes bacterium]|nr:methyl-accepting chemotaxis protein [Spirochaetota bacterium]
MKVMKFVKTLRGQFFSILLLLSLIPLFIVLAIMYFLSRNAILTLTEHTMNSQIAHIHRMCQMQSEELDANATREVDRAFAIFANLVGDVNNSSLLGKKEKHTIINQDTLEKETIELPILEIHNKPMFKNFTLVDDAAIKIAKEGVIASIFLFYNNKLIRISTNQKKEAGERAIFSYIPSESLVSRTIGEGKTYRGRAIILSKWYITRYEPLKNKKGNILGAIGIGIPAPKTVIFDMIRELKIGNEGYAFIINSLGQLIEHPTKKGKTILHEKDPITGAEYIKQIIEQKNGKIEYVEQDGTLAQKKLAVFTYFPNWDWYIVASASKIDIMRSVNAIFVIVMILIGVTLVALSFLSNHFAQKFTKPLRQVIDITMRVSNGDLTAFIPQSHYVKCAEEKNCTHIECPAHNNPNRACWRIEGTLRSDGTIVQNVAEKFSQCKECIVYQKSVRNEVEEMIEATNNMIQTLRKIVRNISQSAESLDEATKSLVTIGQQLQEESQNQAASIEETSSAYEELTASIENVSNSAGRQAETASKTDEAMKNLVSAIKTMGEKSNLTSNKTDETAKQAEKTKIALDDTIQSIAQISESSKKIGDIVAIINDISDQINLLSLNASIEAARAGEHGRGFSVVAEEISKLADATAGSTKEIELLIKNSMSDIERGAALIRNTATTIGQMIATIEEAATLVREIARLAEEQAQKSELVMNEVGAVSEMSTQIAAATEEQKATSLEILKAVSRINTSIQEIAALSDRVAQLVALYSEKSDQMKNSVSMFHI